MSLASLLPSWILIKFHKVVDYNSRVCHDLYQGQIFKSKVTVCTHVAKIRVKWVMSFSLLVGYLYMAIHTICQDPG